MPPQNMPIGDIVAGPPGPGPEAIRRALRGPPGRLALHLPAPCEGARLRVAIALLEQAGASRGGSVLRAGDGSLLLTEATAREAERAGKLLTRLFGVAVARIAVPQDLAPLAALAGLAPASAPAPAAPSAAGIEAMADAAPLPALLRRDGILHIAPGTSRQLAYLRLRLSQHALRPHLGAAADDPDLVRHASDRLRARVLSLLADPGERAGLLGGAPPVPLLLDLPAGLLPGPPTGSEDEQAPIPALLAAVTPSEALGEGLDARRAGLRRAGWGLAVRGLDAAALALLAPEALPADLLLLRWSPAFPSRATAAALRRIDPARLILTGCTGPEALEWGLSLGIARYAGPWIAALMAATRMAGCPHAGSCTRALCIGRGEAATPQGRAGCTDPARLGALVSS